MTTVSRFLSSCAPARRATVRAAMCCCLTAAAAWSAAPARAAPVVVDGAPADGTASASAAADSANWPARLEAALARLGAARGDVGFGVYVRDLATGRSASFHGDEHWYLASTVKVPVAIAVLQGVDRGEWSLDRTTLRLRAADLVDGAGETNAQPLGSALSLRYLLHQMLVYSDNTASDLLIGLVGVQRVNRALHALVPQGFERITTLADVRRNAYGQLDPAATRLVGADFLLLKRQASDAQRLVVLSRLLGTPPGAFRLPSVTDAFDAYYASGLNSARLDAYADLLQMLVEGRALSPASTAYLLGVMEHAETGAERIKAGLPREARFAHKTGTQRARTCDSGLVTMPREGAAPQRVIVVSCTRGEVSTLRSDRALRDVGTAICQSGLFSFSTSTGDHHVPSCDPVLPRDASSEAALRPQRPAVARNLPSLVSSSRGRAGRH